MEAVVFVGIQGSGKTSFYRERFFKTHIRINLDMLRTRHREEVLFRACLAARQSFVIDNTNPLRTDRARYIPEARHAGFRVIAYSFGVPLRDAMERNSRRGGRERIPPMALAATFRKLQAPSIEEGFDQIYTVTIAPGGSFLVTEGTSRRQL